MSLLACGDDVFMAGRLEGLKFGVHLVLFGGSVAALLYNLGSWSVRRERHLGVNVMAYTALSVFEVRHLYCHAHKRDGA